MFTIPENALILFFKAQQHALFAAPVTVQGHTRANGTFVAPYVSRRKKRMTPSKTADLLGAAQTRTVASPSEPPLPPTATPVEPPKTRPSLPAPSAGGSGGGHGGNDGEPPDKKREAQRQYAEVVARYTNPDGTKKDGWLKAPNGQPTKLNERQWVQVRTENFKQWFGDWEIAAKLDWLDHGDPVASMRGDEVPRGIKITGTADWMVDQWQKTDGQQIPQRDLGLVTINKKTVKDSFGHSFNPEKIQALWLIPKALRESALLGKLPEVKGKPEAYLLAAPVKIGDKTYRMLMEVRRDINSQRLYLHEVIAREERSATALMTPAALPSGSVATVRRHGAIFEFMRALRETQADASKVVDENGEPLVVYHGSARKGEEANLSYIKTPAYFTESTLEASAYTDAAAFARMMTLTENMTNGVIKTKRGLARAKRELTNPKILNQYFGGGMTGGVFPAFLNIRNPKILNWTQGNRFSRERMGTEQHANQLTQALIDQRFDGVQTLSDDGMAPNIEGIQREIRQWVAFSPTQIKSALGNTGAFDAKDAHINKAWPFPPSVRILFFTAEPPKGRRYASAA